MIRQAVVLAAGKGTRIRDGEDDLPKPLHTVGGLTLLERTVATLAQAGVTHVVVVVGFMADTIRTRALHYASHVEWVENPDYERANGVSLLKARGAVSGPFILSMSDHVYDAELPRRLVSCDLETADLYLCVDRRVADVYDIDDATKVRTQGDRIVDIGKTLTDYDCIDCGVFAVSDGFLRALADTEAEKGDCSLSDGVRRLASAGRARAVDIGTAFWQDVDTPGARKRAEEMMR